MKALRATIGVVALLAICAALASGGSRADSVWQRYLPAGNALRTVAKFGTARTVTVRSLGEPNVVRADPRWLVGARPLGAGAPGWARRMYRRSLLVLHALTNERSGAVLAGARKRWDYIWPRDAGTAAIALAEAGYRDEARRIVTFLERLDLGAAARFHSDGSPVAGRAAQGDAAGWLAAAARATGMPSAAVERPRRAADARGQSWRALD
ncbi:MAG: glycoside hydrolase family 15 protein, partial [Thermoleophilia bacterium]